MDVGYEIGNTNKKFRFKHFLNKRLKGTRQIDGRITYPVYMRVTYDRKVAQLRSKFVDFEEAEDDFELRSKDPMLPYHKDFIVSWHIMEEIYEHFDPKLFTKKYHYYSTHLSKLLSIVGVNFNVLSEGLNELKDEKLRYKYGNILSSRVAIDLETSIKNFEDSTYTRYIYGFETEKKDLLNYFQLLYHEHYANILIKLVEEMINRYKKY